MTKGQTARQRALQAKNYQPSLIWSSLLNYWNESVCTAVSIWTWMFPSTHMEDARCFLMIPLPPLRQPHFLPCGQSMVLGPVYCPLFVVTTGDVFQEHCNHKAPFWLSTVLPVQLSMPPGPPSPPGSPLSPCLPPTVLPSAERRHLTDRAIVSRPAHCLLLSLTVMRFD